MTTTVDHNLALVLVLFLSVLIQVFRLTNRRLSKNKTRPFAQIPVHRWAEKRKATLSLVNAQPGVSCMVVLRNLTGGA